MTRMGFRMLRGTCLSTLLAAIIALPGVAPALGAASSNTADTLCEYGITLALDGESAQAESVFISLLSQRPHDAGALNNLGNLALLDGDPGLAAAFYGRAAEADTADPGIALNQATALALLGDEPEALLAAESGVARAGGFEPAASLLGLFVEREGPEEPRGSRRKLSREEALHLLKVAAGKVPPDSTRSGPTAAAGRMPSPRWRLASLRSSRPDEPVTSVYWKR